MASLILSSLHAQPTRSRYNDARLTPALEQLSVEAAKQSLVLLKNANNTLPLFAELFGGGGGGVPDAPVAVAVVGIEAAMDAGYDTGGGGKPDVLTSQALNRSGSAAAGRVRAAAGCLDGAGCREYAAGPVAAAVAGAGVVLVFLGSAGLEAEVHFWQYVTVRMGFQYYSTSEVRR